MFKSQLFLNRLRQPILKQINSQKIKSLVFPSSSYSFAYLSTFTAASDSNSVTSSFFPSSSFVSTPSSSSSLIHSSSTSPILYPLSSISSLTSSPPKPPLVSAEQWYEKMSQAKTEEEKIKEISNAFKSASELKFDSKKEYGRLLIAKIALVLNTMEKKMELTQREFNELFCACSELPVSEERTKVCSAYYHKLLEGEKNADSKIPIHIFEHYMRICTKANNVTEAASVARDLHTIHPTYDKSPSQNFMLDYIIILATQKNVDEEKLDSLWAKFQVLRVSKRWAGIALLYAELAKCYSRLGRSADVLVVLKNMTDNYEPTPQLSGELLQLALVNSDANVLYTLAGWYLSQFTYVRLDYGVLTKMLQVAAAAGHQKLAVTALDVSYCTLARLCNS